ncbi:MAG: DsbA family protein [Pseudomonadota bacterium]
MNTSDTTPAIPLSLEVFTDFVCPWCYLGNAVVKTLQASHPLQVTRTPFPLHPSTPVEGLLLSELLRGANLDAIHARLYALMDELKLPHGKRDYTYNSRLAQELAMWGDTQDGGERLHDLLYETYFVYNRNLAKPEVLLDCVDKAGLDKKAAQRVINERSFSGAVDTAWQRARDMQITGVPTFVAGGYMVSGFRPVEEMQHFFDVVREHAGARSTSPTE